MTLKKDISENIIKIEEKKYSYNELIELKNKITDKFSNYKIKTALVQKTNSINIYYSDKKIKETINKYISENINIYKDGMVNFIYDENNIAVAQKSAYPGNEIYYKTGFLNLSKVR